MPAAPTIVVTAAEILGVMGDLRSHAQFTISPKPGAFGEHQDVVSALAKGINISNMLDIVSAMGVDKLQSHFDIISPTNQRVDFNKLGQLADEYRLARLKVLAGNG